MSLKQTATLNETFRITDMLAKYVHLSTGTNVYIIPLNHWLYLFINEEGYLVVTFISSIFTFTIVALQWNNSLYFWGRTKLAD